MPKKNSSPKKGKRQTKRPKIPKASKKIKKRNLSSTDEPKRKRGRPRKEPSLKQAAAKRQFQQVLFSIIQICQQLAYFDIRILSKKSLDPFSPDKKLQSPKAKAIFTKSKFTKDGILYANNYYLIYKGYYALLLKWFEKVQRDWRKVPENANAETKEKYQQFYRHVSYALSFLYRPYKPVDDIKLSDQTIKLLESGKIKPIRELYAEWRDNGSDPDSIPGIFTIFTITNVTIGYLQRGCSEIMTNEPGGYSIFTSVLKNMKNGHHAI